MSSQRSVVAHWLAVAVWLASSGSAVVAQTGPSLSNVGTLTCVTSETPPAAIADAELSCRFHAQSGSDVGFTGYIARKGHADLPTGKRVLVWSVQAAIPDIEPSSVAGKYAGQSGGQPPGRLIGGSSGAIVLDPVTRTASDGPVPTVLELRLEPVRA